MWADSGNAVASLIDGALGLDGGPLLALEERWGGRVLVNAHGAGGVKVRWVVLWKCEGQAPKELREELVALGCEVVEGVCVDETGC